MALILNKRLQTGFEVSAPILTFSNSSVGAQQPQDLIIDYNGSATLTAIAKAVNPSTGSLSSGTISYQWYKNGAALVGEISQNLYLSSQLIAANYYCTATFVPSSGVAPAINGQLISRTCNISIKAYITITSQPSYKRITEGQSALFEISANISDGNTSSLRYEWYSNGKILNTTVGGTYSSVTVSPGAGSYQIYCKVFQGGVPAATAAPAVNSSIVTLDVDPKPTPTPTPSPTPSPTPTPTPREASITLINQKNANQNYDRSQVVNTKIKSWANTTAGEGYGEGSPPIGNSAVSLGVGQWELISPDRDCEVAIEMAGAAGEGATGWNNAFAPGGQGGVGVIYLKLLKGVVYTFHIGRTGSGKNPSKYPNQSAPGGGWSASEMPNYNGNGGGATYLYKGGRLIAVAAGGGGSGRGARKSSIPQDVNNPPNPGAAGGGPGVDGASATTLYGGTGGTQSGPGNNRTTSDYNRDTRSNGRDFWMRDGECATWIPGANDGACGCTYTNSSKQTYSDSTSPKRILDDDSPLNTVAQSCDTYGTSVIA